MNAIITCGPASIPIDEVRRITNHASGESGVLLAREALANGLTPVIFRGEGATFPWPTDLPAPLPFRTNEDLAEGLHAVDAPSVAALFHAAALSDFTLDRIDGAASGERKIPSRGTGELVIRLKRAAKLLPRLRAWFPSAQLIGWKYELDGTRQEAIDRGLRQLSEGGGDAVVVNGRAYGAGFGLLHADGSLRHFADKATLARALFRLVVAQRSAS